MLLAMISNPLGLYPRLGGGGFLGPCLIQKADHVVLLCLCGFWR
jgi:hypothetical protein